MILDDLRFWWVQGGKIRGTYPKVHEGCPEKGVEAIRIRRVPPLIIIVHIHTSVLTPIINHTATSLRGISHSGAAILQYDRTPKQPA